ncbi:hypothetical protein EV182_003596 [Spiromyces aspiralis]|uniref:Uncharacterized protein n=1 Tax=Spiromyces aspiralis TaxID=68401 RepID=A0ACC1HCH3_9FUNG|nr:hypothetical protein EV182_003596 [Spiromyces aspiralis]
MDKNIHFDASKSAYRRVEVTNIDMHFEGNEEPSKDMKRWSERDGIKISALKIKFHEMSGLH